MADGQKILDDGCKTTCAGDGAEFKGIGYRYLVALAQMDPNNSAVQSVLNNSATSNFGNAYDATTGSFFTEWAGPANPNADFGSETAASMAVGTLGTTALAQTQRTYDADVYEAEEAYTNGPTLEALHGAFSGWGYVAAWNADGQTVTFTVNVQEDGNYNLTWRYTASAAATRNLTIPAEQINTNVMFPSTNGFDAYSTVSTPVFLHAGLRPITLSFSSASGSTAAVNLDQLRIDAAPKSTTCTAPAAPTLVSPVLDQGACGNANFAWTSTAEPSHYAVVVDQNIVCTVPGGTHSCPVDLSAMPPGRHNWSVRAANDCTTTASAVGEFNGTAAMVTPLQNVHVSGSTLAWNAPPAAQNAQVDVLLNGQLVCSQVLASQCILPPSSTGAGPNSVLAVVHNACGQVPAPAETF